ncbi:LLM class F420-dependent oxidoreductase [Actinomadura sediminis]|uniref:LLM class F420-dependent oxidoreductase n=1 Tax=Actinomadura sediminis TaxID=1038904 RepID=A0ABW3EUQ4_9ACTN
MIELGMMAPFADGLITSGGFLRDYAGTLEECGVESVWTVEHVVVAAEYEPRYPYSSSGRIPGPPEGVPMPDPLDTIAYMAGGSRVLRFGTAMVVAPLHSPVVLAKRAATIDLLSGGRLMLGLGIGWQKEEYAAVGVPYERRGARLDECIGAMRELWSRSPATYRGEFVSFDRVHCLPRPEAGTVPIVLGGNSEPAVRRAGRVADGWFPYTIAPGEFTERAELLRTAAAGRTVEITAWPGSCDPAREADLDFVRRYVGAGAARIVIAPRLGGRDGVLGPRGLTALREQIARYRDTVLEKL